MTPSLVRRRHGRGHTYQLDGERAPGVTTLLKAGYPAPGLIKWAADQIIDHVDDYWDELAELTPSARRKRLEGARWAKRDEAAVRGQDVHDLAARLAEPGVDVLVPEHLRGHVESYQRFADEWDVHELLVETPVARRDPRYCGTLDLIADLADHRRWLLDFKTTGKGVFRDNALQLAGYRYADFFIGSDGAEHPIPEVDACGVVWLRADGYDLHELDAGPRMFRLFRMVAEIARLADLEITEKYGGEPFDVISPALTPPPMEASA
jgi:hypothetical protein